jgi:CRP-like cAMP-binding protein
MPPFMPDTIRESLLRFQLFSSLDDDDLALLIPGVHEYKIRAHEILFHKGDHLHGIHLLQKGQVKLFLPTSQGTEKVIAMVNVGKSFGEAAVFNDMPCPVSAQATKDSVLLVVSKDALLAVLDHSPLFARKMLSSISMRLHEMMLDMETCTLMNSVQRVVCYLSHQAPEQNPAQYEIALDTSKQTLASQLNLAPETFSRALHHLVNAGLIDVQGRTIRVKDAQRLKLFLG